MNKFKRAFSLLLAVMLLFSLGNTVLAAPSFSDLEGHWSASYIKDMADRGLLEGYPDGTVRPDKNITACESLVFLSRFYDLTDEELEFLYEDYLDIAKANVPSSLDWAYDEIAVCLAANIVTVDELKTIDLSAEIQKEQLAVFIVRAMRCVDAAKALTGTSLDYGDKSSITSGYLGYVEFLTTNKIVNGDENHNFTPRLAVTRAVVSAMVSRSLEYISSKNISMKLDPYSGMTSFSGVITAVGTGEVTLCDTNGLARICGYDSATTITIDGKAASLSSDCIGYYVKVVSDSSSITKITASSSTLAVQGSIAYVNTNSSTRYIRFTETSGSESTKYTVPSSAKVSIDGKSSSYSSLKSGLYATLIMDSNEDITEIIATSGDYKLSGTIKTLNYGPPTTLQLLAGDGSIYSFNIDLANAPSIKLGQVSVTVDKLTPGDAVTIVVESGKITEISFDSSPVSIAGTLTTIVSSSGSTSWIITDGNGEFHTLKLSDAAIATKGGTSISVSSITSGTYVKVVTYGGTITEIEVTADESGGSADKLTGTVLAINSKTLQMVVLSDSGSLCYVKTNAAKSIISASTGKNITVYSIASASRVIVYGSYSDTSNFAATSIIVED